MFGKQHELFVLWLKAYKGSKWELIEKLDPVMVEMAWQTNANSVDCGIFVMRHMESFMGQPWNGWRTGLDIESVRNKKIQIMYMSTWMRLF